MLSIAKRRSAATSLSRTLAISSKRSFCSGRSLTSSRSVNTAVVAMPMYGKEPASLLQMVRIDYADSAGQCEITKRPLNIFIDPL